MKIIPLSLFFLLTTSLFGGVVYDGLKQVSLNDKLAMEEFIELNLKWHQLSHVIYFDNKPMCFTSARLKSPDKQPMDTFWIKGWKAFKKNEHLFPHSNFIFNCNIDENEDGWKSINLFIINKRALVKCLNNHLHIFQQILGQRCSFDWLVAELESKKSVYEILKNNERLIGILLGYGEESATAFYQAISSGIGIPPHTSSYCPVEVKTSKGCKLFPIVIMGDPHSAEVQSIISLYEKELDEFWHIYQQQDSLELFFKCICSEKDDGYHQN